MARLVVLLPLAAVAAVAGVLVTVLVVLVPVSTASTGAFQPGDAARLKLSEAQLAQAARALTVADGLKAGPLPTLAMVVAALGESNFEAVPNGAGSGYCGVFQAHPRNIACDDTEGQAESFLEGGRGFQAGGAIHLARTVADPGAIATRVEASGKRPSFYGGHRPQAERIIAAWRAGGLTSTVSSGVEGSPKHIIDTVALPIARACGVPKTPAEIEAANAAHSVLTTAGYPSDHKGPPDVAWAADLNHGSEVPTPQMDCTAEKLAERFGIPWTGSGLVNATHGGYRYQLIYRYAAHYDHVHIGIKILAGPPSP